MSLETYIDKGEKVSLVRTSMVLNGGWLYIDGHWDLRFEFNGKEQHMMYEPAKNGDRYALALYCSEMKDHIGHDTHCKLKEICDNPPPRSPEGLLHGTLECAICENMVGLQTDVKHTFSLS